MKIKILNDNRPGKCPAEHGLSYIIESRVTILFDTGPSDIFIKNANLLGINLDKIDTVVLSHGHWDHGNGLKYIQGKKLICHPECFVRRYRKKDDSYIGLPITQQDASKKFQLVLTKQPYQIAKDMVFLGEIPRKNEFEAKTTTFYKEGGEDDFISDDSAVAIKSKKGLIVIAGCSHAGICNIIEYAKKVTKSKKVYAVIGGLHLKEIDSVTLKTIEYFKKEKIQRIYPSHCVEDKVLNKFRNELNSFDVLSGDIIVL